MKTASFIRSHLLPCAGLVVPPALLAANTEIGLLLPYAECGAPLNYSALLSLPLAVLCLAASLLSWQVTKRNPSDASLGVTPYPASFGFVGLLSGLAGPLFAFALVLQGLAGLTLTGCER